MRQFDVLVVGSGPAGQRAAIQAAKLGKSAAIIERKPKIGGVGLQTGTIPSKALREVAYTASLSGLHGVREALQRAGTSSHGFLAEAVRKKDMVIAQQESVILNQLMRNGVDLISGEASFVDAHTLCVRNTHGEEHLKADYIILGTGSRPRRPDFVPFDKKTVLDSTSILNMKRLPRSLTVIGGGIIACEFACIFAALDVAVTVVDTHERILSFLSHDIEQILSEAMYTMGIAFHLNTKVEKIHTAQDEVMTCMEDGLELRAERLLYAMGRVPNVDGLMLERAGVCVEQHGWLEVNEHFQTQQPHIYAVGDLIGRPALASTAMAQGRLASVHAFDAAAMPSHQYLPMAIYTIPEVSYVGKTGTELREEGIEYVVGRGYFKESARGQIIGDHSGMLKMNVSCKDRRILGVHIVGESASELVHIGQLVMNLNGTVDDIVNHVFNYPTLAETYKTAALDCLNQLYKRENRDD